MSDGKQIIHDQEGKDIVYKLEDMFNCLEILDEKDYDVSVLYFDLVEYWSIVGKE